MPRFSFNSGPLNFLAGVETSVGRIRTQPGRQLRIAAFEFGPATPTPGPNDRLRLSGPGCADWNVLVITTATIPTILPLFLVLARDTEIEIFYTRQNANAAHHVRALGWHF
jgi:hypothetical protein